MRRSRSALAVALLLTAVPIACRPVRAPGPPAIPPRTTVAFPEGYRARAGAEARVFPRAAVASESQLASEAGAEVLAGGGNAIDGAVATAFALAVTYPEAGNLGGGGFALGRLADGRRFALDFRETAPAAATRDMFLDASGAVAAGRSTLGHLASGVPGTVAGLVTVQARYGRLSLAAVMAPAIRLARQGFIVDAQLARSIAGKRTVIAKFAGAARFLPGGEPLAAGDTLRQPELAATLDRIAEHGAKGFYEGETAEALVAEMRRGGGLVTAEDLERYRPIWRKPLETRYRGYTLIAMPPPSSGGVTIGEVLGILSTWETPAPFGSTAAIHRLASAYQRAFLDRNTRLGDPDFGRLPVAELLSERHTRALRATIDESRATPTTELLPAAAAALEGTETTHLSVADEAGNTVALTTTLNDLWGSGVYVAAAGFFLNDEMDDFTARPGVPNMFGLVQGAQNAVQPGKRPLSAMSPTIVLDSAGQTLLVVGSRGGPRIITSTSQVILDVIDHGMGLADAVRAPRFHHQALPDILAVDPFGVQPAVADSLRAMGWKILTPMEAFQQEYIGAPLGVMRVNGGWAAAADGRRGEGVAGF